MSGYAATDYVDVAHRLVEFRDKHPDGCLQPANLAAPYSIEEIGGQMFIVVVAAAYRSPDDVRPGIGMAYEVFPGKTNFTRGSELQNAETSAWGRAIVAALAADAKLGIASAEEMRNRAAEQVAKPRAKAPEGPPVRVARPQAAPPREPTLDPADSGPKLISKAQMGKMQALFSEKLFKDREDRMAYVQMILDDDSVTSSSQLSVSQASKIIDALEKLENANA